MRRKLPTVAGLVLSMCLFAAVTSAQQQIQLYATIVDSAGAPVTTLKPDDVRVLENGVEAKVVKVEPITWTTKVQLLIDNGSGLGAGNLSQLRTGVRGLIEALPMGVEVTLVTTSPQPRFIVRATTDREAQLAGIDKIAPDTGAGRFIESLNEALQRIERDKTDFYPVIVSLGTTSGDARVLDRDVNQINERLEKRPTTVHVVILSGGAATASGGFIQQEVGMRVSKYTRGRYEAINASSRIATLLPEIGAQIAKGSQGQSQQFRITADRPGGASGAASNLSMSAKAGMAVTSLTMDGRIP
jgi:hypothetical protein